MRRLQKKVRKPKQKQKNTKPSKLTEILRMSMASRRSNIPKNE